jgi:hypothetical protein
LMLNHSQSRTLWMCSVKKSAHSKSAEFCGKSGTCLKQFCESFGEICYVLGNVFRLLSAVRPAGGI